MRIHVLSVGMVMLTAVAPLCSAETARSLDETLALVSARLSEVCTLRSRELWRMEIEVQGTKQITEMESALVFERPRRVHVKTRMAVIVSDGSNVFVRLPMSRRYMALPADTSLDEVVARWSGFLYGFTPEKGALLSVDPLNTLREALRDGGGEVLPDEVVDGRECFVLRYAPPRAAFLPVEQKLKIWLDKESGLLRRAASEALPEQETEKMGEEGEDDAAHWRQMLRKARFSVTIMETTVNGPVSDEDFAFIPAPGDTKVETSFGLVSGVGGAAAGFERFALSGKPAPDFSLTLLDGQSFSLSAQTGSVVLIDFWATWCGPCVMALPDVRALDEQYRTKGLVIVGVSRDRADQKDKVAQMVKEKRLAYPVGLDGDPSIAELYGVEGIPCLVLIGRDGVVQGRKVGFSAGGLETIKKEIETVLAGQTIPGAEPLTEAELRDIEASKRSQREWRQRSTALDTNVFRLVWKYGPETRMTRLVEAGETVQVGIVPPFVVVPAGDRIVVLGVEDGQERHSLPVVPELGGTNEMGQAATLFFLRTPTGGVVVAVQRFYDVTRDEGGSKSYSTRRTRLTGVGVDGGVVWTQELDRTWYLQSAGVLPSSDGSDVLMIASSDGLALYDAGGQQLLRQRLAYGTRLWFFQAAPDQRLRVILQQEGKVALYDVILPKPSASASL